MAVPKATRPSWSTLRRQPQTLDRKTIAEAHRQAEALAASLTQKPAAHPEPTPAKAAQEGTTMPKNGPLIRSYVSDFARAHNIDLSKVAPEDSKELTLVDVCRDAERRSDFDVAAMALSAQFRWNAGVGEPPAFRGPASSPRGALSRYDVDRTRVDAMARNPLVDRIRSAASAAGRRGPAGAPPTVFASGDTPAFTASGIPASAVLGVPWPARHPMAAAPTAADAYRIQSECAGPDGAESAARAFANDPGNQDYADRVDRWRLGSLTDQELNFEGTTAAKDERDRRMASLPDLPEDDENAIADFARQFGR
jgi:hypothetical protein